MLCVVRRAIHTPITRPCGTAYITARGLAPMCGLAPMLAVCVFTLLIVSTHLLMYVLQHPVVECDRRVGSMIEPVLPRRSYDLLVILFRDLAQKKKKNGMIRSRARAKKKVYHGAATLLRSMAHHSVRSFGFMHRKRKIDN